MVCFLQAITALNNNLQKLASKKSLPEAANMHMDANRNKYYQSKTI